MTEGRRESWWGAWALTLAMAWVGGELVAMRLDPEGAYISREEVDRACGRRLKSGEDLRGKSFTWIGKAGKRHEFRQDVTINGFGFHDREHAVSRKPGSRRVLVVGDSFVEAYQVALESAFPRLLESALRRDGLDVEVIAIGRSGWGSAEYASAIAEWAPKLDAEATVWCFYPGNDVRDASPEAKRLHQEQEEGPLGALWRHQEVRDLPGILIPSSALNRLLSRAWRTAELRREAKRSAVPFRVPVDFFVYADESLSFVEEGWRRTEDDLRAARESLARRGARFIVVSLTDVLRMAASDDEVRRNLERSYPDARYVTWRFDKPEIRLGRFLAGEGVPYLNLQDRFREQFRESRLPYHFPSDGHWNERGHAMAAEQLAPVVRGELLP